MVDKIHNHEGTRSSSHVAHRQNEMDEEFIEYVDHATGSGETEGQIRRELNDANVLTGAKPSDIWINWRKDHPDTSIQQKDIYNAKTKIRQRRLGPYTPTQALLKALHRDNWFVKILLDEASKRVRRLVFVNKLAKEILGKNSVVIVMHCTYKTNKYVMPMLVIMGHTSLYSSFYIGFAFIETEGEEDFVWILEQLTALFKALGLNEPWVIVTDKDLALMNAIKIVYPRINHLLCLCHINKNILKNCKPSFETQEQWQEFLAAWYRVVYAPTKDECEEAWKNLAEEYEEDYSDECDYIHETWLVRWARRFCKAYTNKVTHFGTCTTSRVEGGPCVLKAKLKCSTGDLIAVVEGLEALLSNQHESYLHNLDVAKMKTPVNLPRDLMRDLLGRVTPYALGKIRKQYKHLRKAERKPDKYPLKPCTDVFFTTMGLPCAHRIKERIEAVEGGAGKLILELDVHPHWRFAKPEETFCTSTEFESDLPTTQTPFYVPPTEALETDDFDPFESPEVESLLRRSSSRIESPPRTEAELEVDDVLDVQEPNKVKKKGRPKGSANKKDVMTRAEEMAVKSTKHDPSGFEIVEQALEQRRKRAKTDTEANNSTGRGGRGGRRGRERGRGGRGGATSIRKKALREEHIEVSSDSESEDSESDDGFNDLDSDEEFTDSEAEGEDELNMR